MSSEIEFDVIPDGELYKWEQAGQTVTGILKNYTAQPDRGKGPGNVYEVQTKEGLVTFFAPSLLHRKLQNVKIGDIVQVKFTAITKTNNGNTLKNFEVGRTAPTPEKLRAMGIEMFDDVADDGFGDV